MFAPNNNWNKFPNKLVDQQVQQKQVKIDIPPGRHLQQIGGVNFIIDKNYICDKIIGSGSFGIVASGKNLKTGQPVAIKKVKDVFRNVLDAKRVFREIKLLMFLEHKNIIGLLDIIEPVNENFDEVYLVFELMQSDLEKVINSHQKLTDKHIKVFMEQILQSIAYLHSANVIHRDLKPSNIFVNKQCHIRVGDLNLARKFENINHITEYVVTRWYRAPEILFSQADYKQAIDVWSIGCIFAELIIRCPLFKGEHFLNQIECIVAILGTPDEDDLPYKVDEQSMKYIKQQLPKREKIPFKDLFPNADPLAIDLLSKMLVYNPNKRYTVEQCLQHEYFKDRQTQIKKCDKVFDWSFDNLPLNKQIVQKAMYDAIIDFKKNLPANQVTPLNQVNSQISDQAKAQQQNLLKQQLLSNKNQQVQEMKDFKEQKEKHFQQVQQQQKSNFNMTQPIQFCEQLKQKKMPVVVEKHISFSDKIIENQVQNQNSQDQKQLTPKLSQFQPSQQQQQNSEQNQKAVQEEADQCNIDQIELMRRHSFGDPNQFNKLIEKKNMIDQLRNQKESQSNGEKENDEKKKEGSQIQQQESQDDKNQDQLKQDENQNGNGNENEKLNQNQNEQQGEKEKTEKKELNDQEAEANKNINTTDKQEKQEEQEKQEQQEQEQKQN
ncbi:Protein kinase-like domain [Pseudocohnilembus persalinus]|uniref:Mitogen-activated protein kinase n=1 Tax=Pseudocohnilembus persalinus TaxID=266149 RepID=A0A0V0QM17_PSEPJ|nr:Protein kinase-like domain [Pseudocohnilembus persalinus]|eukprot:KRX03298.1 Protein kinase-like domain [Pseudocohnilembus persalinus]